MRSPRTVYLLALPNGLPTSVSIPFEIFELAGQPIHQWGQPHLGKLFDAQVVSPEKRSGATVTMLGGIAFADLPSAHRMKRPDLLLVGSAGFDPHSVVRRFGDLLPLLRRWHSEGCIIAGACSGVVLLAESGLLDNRVATTHWALAPWLRQRYPRVRLKEELMVTQDSAVWCAAGGHACQDLALELTASFGNPEMTRQCAKGLVLDMPRNRQSPYMLHTDSLNHGDELIAASQRAIASQLEATFEITALAAHANLSVRSFMRRFKQTTGTSPLVYQQRLRIESAKEKLMNRDIPISDIGALVGYSDTAFFRRLFKRETGVTPSRYRDLTRSEVNALSPPRR